MPNENYLMHYGILKMRWGIRRYQNPDGTLTEAGKKRYLKSQPGGWEKKKAIDKTVADTKTMSAEELAQKIDLLQKQKQYLALSKELDNWAMQTAIDTIRLDNTYKELTAPPKNKKKEIGEKFTTKAAENISNSVAKVMGTAVEKAGKNYVDKILGELAKPKTSFDNLDDKDDEYVRKAAERAKNLTAVKSYTKLTRNWR